MALTSARSWPNPNLHHLLARTRQALSLCTVYAGAISAGTMRRRNFPPCNAMRMVRSRDWKYVEIEGGSPLLFNMVNDPDEQVNLTGKPEHSDRCREMRMDLFRGFSWEGVHRQLTSDRERIKNFQSGQKAQHSESVHARGRQDL